MWSEWQFPREWPKCRQLYHLDMFQNFSSHHPPKHFMCTSLWLPKTIYCYIWGEISSFLKNSIISRIVIYETCKNCHQPSLQINLLLFLFIIGNFWNTLVSLAHLSSFYTCAIGVTMDSILEEKFLQSIEYDSTRRLSGRTLNSIKFVGKYNWNDWLNLHWYWIIEVFPT